MVSRESRGIRLENENQLTKTFAPAVRRGIFNIAASRLLHEIDGALVKEPVRKETDIALKMSQCLKLLLHCVQSLDMSSDSKRSARMTYR